MEFQGFTPETGAFLWDLSFNNERPWFLAHKEEFETRVNRPFRALCDATLARMQARFPDCGFQAHVSRIYRDARRLFGRGPYKDHLWFALYCEARHTEGPMFWFELGPAAYGLGLGCWDETTALMDAFRRQIDANPARFERILRDMGPGWRLWGQEYKRPKGERGALIDPWYNRKSLNVGLEWDLGGEAFSASLPETLTGYYARLMPMFEYQHEAWRKSREESL